MKKILILLLVLALSVASVVSCGKKNNGGENSNDENQGTTGNGGSNPEEEPGIDKEPEPELPGVDLINADLSDYIEIDEKYYKNYTVNVDPDRVSTLDIENKIIQILCDYKSKEPVEGDGVISVGDVAHIYYKGYYMKDGEKYFFEGGDNSSSSTPHALEIGSGGFIPGFEYNLIGKNPADYTEESPIVVETFFPENYQSAELAGKTAYFIVTVKELVEYDAPELNESFLRDTVELTDEDLAIYEGEGIVEKFRAYLKDSIAKENGLDVETLSLDAFWKSVMEGAIVKKYPEKQVKEIYDGYVSQLEGYYQYYYSSYYGHDEFMCLYKDKATAEPLVVLEEVYDEVKHKIPDEVFRQAYNDVIRNAYMGDKLQGIIPCMGIQEFLDKLDKEIHGEESTGSTHVPLTASSVDDSSSVIPDGFIREGIGSEMAEQPVPVMRRMK